MALGLAETARLAVDLSLKGNFASSLAASQKALGRFDKSITATQGRAYKAGQQIGTGIKTGAVIAASGVAFLITQVGAGIQQLARLETATAQTNAVLKSTKGVSGQTAESVRKLAEQYENLNATIDDKVIQSGENLLLTFTNIRKEAFEPALEAALNLNTRLGGGEGGLQNTIKLLGKALNDPLKGLGALSKAGITFSKQQTDQIKTLVKNNDLLGAQNLILTELGKRYGGAFKAEGDTATGTFRGIGDAVEDLQKALATGLFPTIQKLLPRLRAALADPKVVATVQKLGDAIAGLFSDDNLKQGGAILSSLFETAKAAAPVVGEAAKATLGAVKAAVSLFTSLPKEVQQLAIGAFAINKITGGLVTNLAGGLISSVLKQLVSGIVNVNGAVVNVVGAGIPGAPGVPGTGPQSIVSQIATALAVVLPPLLIFGPGHAAAEGPGVTPGGIHFGNAPFQLLPKGLFGPEELPPAPAGPVKVIPDNTQRLVRAAERAESRADTNADRIRAATAGAALAARRVEAAENRSALTLSARINGARAAAARSALQLSRTIQSKNFSPRIVIPINSRATTIINGRSFTGNVNRQTILVRPGQASVPS